MLGGLRSAAQMVSYEVALGIIVLNIIICVGSVNLIDIVLFQQYIWFIIPLCPMFFLFFVFCAAAALRREQCFFRAKRNAMNRRIIW